MFFTVAANEDFELRKIDIRAAFLQAKQFDRDLFQKPPKDIKKEKIIWKLKKPLVNTFIILCLLVLFIIL